MIARVALTLLSAAVLLQLATPSVARAGSTNPPPPPPPPGCKSCGGPPPPPTPVPAIPATVSPAVASVSVRLSPDRIRRGHQVKLTVTAARDDAVTVVIRYRHGKPVTFRGKVSSTGTYSKTWMVPKATALGKGALHVAVKSGVSPYSGTISFEIVK